MEDKNLRDDLMKSYGWTFKYSNDGSLGDKLIDLAEEEYKNESPKSGVIIDFGYGASFYIQDTFKTTTFDDLKKELKEFCRDECNKNIGNYVTPKLESEIEDGVLNILNKYNSIDGYGSFNWTVKVSPITSGFKVRINGYSTLMNK